MTTGDQQMLEIMRRTRPILDRLVNRVDACPHEGAMLGYLLGLRRGILDHLQDTTTVRWKRDELVRSIENFIVGVSTYGLPD